MKTKSSTLIKKVIKTLCLSGSVLISANSYASDPPRFEFKTTIDQYKIPFLAENKTPRKFAATIYEASKIPEGFEVSPVVIFSSGMSDEIKNYETNKLFSQLAALGYDVVAFEHPFLDLNVTIEGSNKRRTDSYQLLEFLPRLSKFAAKETRWRARDISCFINLINDDRPFGSCGVSFLPSGDSFNQFYELFPNQDKPDRKIAVIGHSLGGMAAQMMVSDTSFVVDYDNITDQEELSHQEAILRALKNPVFDPRIDVAMNYDGSNKFNYVQGGAIKKPFLYVASDQNWQHWDKFRDTERLMKSRLMCDEDSFLVKINDNGSVQSQHYSPFWSAGNATYSQAQQDLVIGLTDYFIKSSIAGVYSIDDPSRFDYPYEIHYYHTSECATYLSSADDDNDGISNGDELMILASDMSNPDSDGDSVIDGLDHLLSKNIQLDVDNEPWWGRDNLGDAILIDAGGDTDGDSLTLITEAALRTNATKRDSDGDGVRDGQEVMYDHTDPNDQYDYK